MLITFDAETIPDMRPGALDAFIADARENFKAPSGLTKEQAAIDLGITDPKEAKFISKDSMIAQWEREFSKTKADEVGEANWRKTALNGAQGQVVCIGFAQDDGPALSCEGMNETEVLQNFFCWLTDIHSIQDRPLFVGFNHIGFDIRFIWQRAIILGVRPPIWFPRNPKAWDDSVFDVMIEWAGHGNRISMDSLCAALGLPGKPDGIDGSKVWDAVRDGRLDEVASYCRGDVQRTREIYQRMTFAEAA